MVRGTVNEVSNIMNLACVCVSGQDWKFTEATLETPLNV